MAVLNIPTKISQSEAEIWGEIRNINLDFNIRFLDITERLEESWPEPTAGDASR